ncbi:MAG: hypothetical protein AB7S48_11940 [Bacteroidales bacterium]
MKQVKHRLMNCLVFIILLAFSTITYAQKGIPFITNYSLPVSMSTQNYQIIQGDNDIIFVLNQNGIFSFDGYSWEQMPISGQPIAMAYINKLFIGGDQVLGYFKKNLQGINIYVPIEEKKSELFYLFHHFNNTLYAAGVDGIYKIRRVEPYTVEVYYTEKDSTQIITDMFNIGDKFFIIKNKKSIFQIHRQDITPINISIANGEEITFSFTHNDTQILGTSSNKIYRFDGQRCTQISIKDQNYLNASYLTGGISLNNKTIALSTLIGGCVILNSETGETKQIVNYACGLPDDEITAMGKDNHGGLWLIHGMGISRIDTNIPINSYHHIAGLMGNILSVAKQSNNLFIGTSEGLYKLVESKSFATRTVEVPKRIEQRIPKIQDEKKKTIIEQPISINQPQEQKSKAKKGLFSRLFGRENIEQEVAVETVQEKHPVSEEKRNK